jgi:hypothetical protein
MSAGVARGGEPGNAGDALPRKGEGQLGHGTSPCRLRCQTDVETELSPMLKGGLLWLIGIPLPIILILFFLGYLS